MTPLKRLRRLAIPTTTALAAALVLTGCQNPSPSPTASTATTVDPAAFSTLDSAGQSEILKTLHARFDMRSGTLEKSAVGLQAHDLGSLVNTRTASKKIAITIAAPNGEIRGDSDKINFNTVETRRDFSEVTYFLTTDSFDEYKTLIRDGVRNYGIDAASAEGWITSIEARPEDKSDFSITPGTSTGVSVNYDLRYDGSKDTQVIIVHINPVT